MPEPKIYVISRHKDNGKEQIVSLTVRPQDLSLSLVEMTEGLPTNCIELEVFSGNKLREALNEIYKD